MDFDERQLRAFIAVADTGSVGRAAAIVNLTQPSLSRMIQGMEQRLGHRLFDRLSTGVALTPAGEILLDHARLLAFEMQAARDQLDALRGLRRGVVRIGAVAAVMRTLVTSAAAAMIAAYPDLSVEMREGTDSDLLGALLDRKVDLVVTAAPLESDAVEAVGTCAYTDRFGVFCAAENPIADSPGMPELATESWVMPSPAATPRVQFAARFREHGLPTPPVPVETASVETMIAVSAASRLLCWLPGPLVAPHLASGTMRQLDVPALETERQMLLYRRRTGLLPQAARMFLNFLPMHD
ncbi:MAG: LysR family transcriptional regulator [Novosphingobium sp.]|nr:LysR family transcriptional regulator [Novosphingobium sp.]